MFGAVRTDPTPCPYCTLGLHLCRCLLWDSEIRRGGWVPSSNEYAVKYDTPVTRDIPGHEKHVSELLEQIPRHVRPSLSKQWLQTYQPPSPPPKNSKSQPREQTPLEKKRSLRPIMKDHHHQDSLFGNSFQSKSFFTVHPEWLSETVENTDPEPLHRPPWPWEQPRYRQNIQLPITYKVVESEGDKSKAEEEKQKCMDTELPMPHDVQTSLPIGYMFTQPGIDLTRPFEKQTQFGAPVVDTSAYRLSY